MNYHYVKALPKLLLYFFKCSINTTLFVTASYSDKGK